MIYYVNPEMFYLKPVVKEDGKIETSVTTPFKLKRKKDDKEVVIRPCIAKIFSDVEAFENEKTAIRAKVIGKKQVATITASEENKWDNHVFLIALPFNGVAVPIPKNPDLKIYSGTVVKSDKRNIEFNGKFFKKVLYLVAVPNLKALELDPSDKNFREKIDLEFISYNIETENEENHTERLSSTVTITLGEDDYNVAFDSVIEVVDPVDPTEYRGKNIFEVFTPQKKETKPSTKKGGYNHTYKKK